jgi:L-ribulokinase
VEGNYTIGIDFGTDSVRSILVDTSKGEVVSAGVGAYRRWNEGKYCDIKKNQFRQHPLDHIESLKMSLSLVLKKAPKSIISNIKAISVASTGSTPIAVNKLGLPLSMTQGFEENPNAMFILWKDHTALKEAKEINALAHSGKYIDYT